MVAKHGVFKEWYSDGEIKSEGAYKDGNKDGTFIEYKNGDIELEEHYINGNLHGTTLQFWFDEYNKRRHQEERIFDNGKFISSVRRVIDDSDFLVEISGSFNIKNRWIEYVKTFYPINDNDEYPVKSVEILRGSNCSVAFEKNGSVKDGNRCDDIEILQFILAIE